MESWTLSSPQTQTIASWHVQKLHLDWEGAQIFVKVISDSGIVKTHAYVGATATTLMAALNKANGTIKSLHRRVLEQLATDGVLTAGTVTGTPD